MSFAMSVMRRFTDDDLHASLPHSKSVSRSPEREGGGVAAIIPPPVDRDAAAPLPLYAHDKTRSEQGGCS